MITEANAAASNKAKARAIEAASKIFEANTIQDSHDHDTAIVTSGGLVADIAQLILDHEYELTRLRSALEAREWQPAGTAPKDGTEFIACNIAFQPFSCQFWQGQFVHFEPEDGPIHLAFEAWSPMPAAAIRKLQEQS